MKIGEHHGLDRVIDSIVFLFGIGLFAAILTSGWRILDVLTDF